ncbi:MAG: LamG-like jellyroll fold domain-containing protein [Minisyncoccales bacterium]|jgi:prepilin-type N-terminal cleavage/methylation domain-containing protein
MNNKSFTLIELLVVIVIIGILAGVIMISTSSSINKASLAKAQAFSKTVQNELLLDLVSEWTFDEPEVSGKTLDSWGNNNGTIYGPTYQNGNSEQCIFGGCYSFDGANDYIDLDNTVYLAYNNFTISWWMKRTLSRYECIFSSSIGGSNGQIEVSSTNGIRFESRINNIYDITMPTNLDLSDGNWHHFVVSSAPTEFSLYSDGVKTFSNGPNTDATNQAFHYIGVQQLQGTYLYGNYFTGLLDNVRIYNTALSSSRIKQNHIAGLDYLLNNRNISKNEYNKRINVLAYD